MTKKEILIIFVLAFLLTLLSGLHVENIGFVSDQPDSYSIPKTESPMGFPILRFGFPLAWFISHPDNKIVFTNLAVDFLFWFLILAAGWWMIKRLRKRV